MPFSLILSLVAAVIVIQVAVFSTTIYLHRCATHKALILHGAVEWAFKFALWLTTGLATKEWVLATTADRAFPPAPAICGCRTRRQAMPRR